MKSFFVLIPVALFTLACDREPPEPETAAPKTAAAATTTIAGPRRDLRNATIEVTTPLIPSAMASCAPVKTKLKAGEPVQLQLKLNESPSKLVVGARILDEDEEIAYVTVPAEGRKDVMVTVKERLDPGTYALEGYWGGNLVCEHEIVVEPER